MMSVKMCFNRTQISRRSSSFVVVSMICAMYEKYSSVLLSCGTVSTPKLKYFCNGHGS